MHLDLTRAQWLNKPARSVIAENRVDIITDPGTDFWQRTFYGFRNDNAPALLLESAENFTLTTRVSFTYQNRFDQCGLIIYQDSENWFKASIEYENEQFSRLGSVVTNLGHSDWATTDIDTPAFWWYRLSRRGPDFLIEGSGDGETFRQMRIFHLHCLGETTTEMGLTDPPLPAGQPVRFGLYACSPLQSSFTARFSDFRMEASIWPAHAG